MRTVFEDEVVLTRQGWVMLPQDDVCWLDCARPAFCYRSWNGRQIVLCVPHALRLEDGAWHGDYAAAPLPPDSLATAWPWLPLDEEQEGVLLWGQERNRT